MKIESKPRHKENHETAHIRQDTERQDGKKVPERSLEKELKGDAKASILDMIRETLTNPKEFFSNKLSVDKFSYVKKKIESDKKHEETEKKKIEAKHNKQEKIQDKNLRKLIKKRIIEKRTKSQRKRFFEDHIEKAGLDVKLSDVQKKILTNAVILALAEMILLLAFNLSIGAGLFKIMIDSFLVFTLGIVLNYNILFLSFFVYIDIKIYQRKKAVEEVLPEYLQLVAANISAGIPIDQSLWLAVRPQFGVLSKEIEIVAKKSLTGTNLNEALLEFSNKYDSILLKRTIHLIIEGIEAGGPLAQLLERITTDIIETKIMKKEMAANVMTYVIFITFASIVAAPFMFGLANQLVVIITNLMSSLDISSMQSSVFTITQDAIRISDFQIFSVVLLSVTAIFSGMIISVIKNGNVRDGLQNIPVLIAVSLVIYFIAIKAMGMLFAGMF